MGVEGNILKKEKKKKKDLNHSILHFRFLNAEIFKGNWDFRLIFFLLSLLLHATGPVSVTVLVALSLSHVATTGIPEVSAAAADRAHSQVLQEGSRAGGGTRLCLPLAECQTPSRSQCLRTPGKSSHT